MRFTSHTICINCSNHHLACSFGYPRKSDCGHESRLLNETKLCLSCAQQKESCELCGGPVKQLEWRAWYRKHPPLDGYSAVFLDKDGTLVSDDGYPDIIPSDQIFTENTLEGLNHLQNIGYKLIIISNQSWIAKGKLSIERVEEIFQSVLTQFQKHGVEFDGYYYCPHPSRESTCNCRKPKTGLFEQACKEHHLTSRGSYMVGDLPTDIQAGKNFGLKTCRVRTGNGKSLVPDEGVNQSLQPDYDVAHINEFVGLISGTISEKRSS